MRTEKDFLGEKEIEDEALYGIQSARARENFPLGYRVTNPALLRAMISVKKAAAAAWSEVYARRKGAGGGPELQEKNTEDKKKFSLIEAACDVVLNNFEQYAEHFIVDALQGGAGTSTNMNVNEVIAHLASRQTGVSHNTGTPATDVSKSDVYIHPLDDVNRGQSTNDVYPTALRIASIGILRELSQACAELMESLQKKENEFDGIKKLGRTELMDAVPVTLGEEFGAWAQAIGRDRWRLYKIEERLRQVNIGGAAVGILQAEGEERAMLQNYRFIVIEKLREITGIGLASAEYPMDITQNNDVFVEVSGLLKALAVNLSKIAGDLRLMASGPGGGIGEIRLAPLQAGSTIMPGKVNPVIPEMVIQCGIKAQANDMAISIAASRGEFELNAFLPLIADALLESLALLTRAVRIFRTKCIDKIEADRDRCRALLDSSFAFAAGYIGKLGYEQVAAILAAHPHDIPAAKAQLDKEAGQSMTSR
ncbi:MAG: aspartate ammonia-lyase [Spirochaetaceae bacterium]|jgi:aspartate ammonia-lyase|nr:aspartate ammonia-lyase [Spirochaetaceae bacterium]